MKLRNIILAIAALFAAGPIVSFADDGTHLAALSTFFPGINTPPYGLINLVTQDASATNKRAGIGLGSGYILAQGAQATNTKDFFLYNLSTAKFTAYAGTTDIMNLQGLSVGFTPLPLTNLPTSSPGELAFAKVTASGTAPGAGALKLAAVAGTNTGTCKIIAYAGTSTTPVTIVDNVGAGC